MSVRESNIETYLKECVKELGGEVRKLKFIGHRGAPDRLVLLPCSFFLAELKRPSKKKADDHQEREIRRLRRSGIKVEFANSFDAIDEVLERYMK